MGSQEARLCPGKLLLLITDVLHLAIYSPLSSPDKMNSATHDIAAFPCAQQA